MFQTLETRRLFSASAHLKGDVLIVDGTEGNDVVTMEVKQVAEHPLDLEHIFVTVNDTMIGEFDWRAIVRVNINTLGGSDKVDLSNPISRSCYIEAGAGNDTVIASNAPDTLVGGKGNDVLFGGDQDDILSGGTGRDKLMGEGGNDTLLGGDGNDGMSGGAGADRLTGGKGTDTADYSDRSDNLLINIGPIVLPGDWGPFPVAANEGRNPGGVKSTSVRPYPIFDASNFAGCGFKEGDQIDADVEVALGGRGNDVIWGSSRDNILVGNGGDDAIFAGGGANTLYGGNGNDTIYSANNSDDMPGGHPPGSGGYDRVVGGAGNDSAIVEGFDTVVKVEHSRDLPFLSS